MMSKSDWERITYSAKHKDEILSTKKNKIKKFKSVQEAFLYVKNSIVSAININPQLFLFKVEKSFHNSIYLYLITNDIHYKICRISNHELAPHWKYRQIEKEIIITSLLNYNTKEVLKLRREYMKNNDKLQILAQDKTSKERKQKMSKLMSLMSKQPTRKDPIVFIEKDKLNLVIKELKYFIKTKKNEFKPVPDFDSYTMREMKFHKTLNNLTL